MASLVEEWIAGRLRLLVAFESAKVEVYEGSTAQSGQQLVEELIAKATPTEPYAAVMFEGDRAVPLQEGMQAYDPTYAIYVVVKNSRPGAARKGDGTTIGTNGLRDLIRTILHDESPDIAASSHHTELAEFKGVQIAVQRRDAFIMRAEVVVRESPQKV